MHSRDARTSARIQPGMVAPMAQLETDYLVLGTGIAGLAFAIDAAAHGQVTIVTKRGTIDTNTNWAQGGVAAVLADDDSFDQHVADTLTVGDGLCDRKVVEGSERLHRLRRADELARAAAARVFLAGLLVEFARGG